MADGGSTTQVAHKSLSLKDVDRIHECAYKARGIIAVIRIASSNRDQLPEDALPGACWAAESLIEEMVQVATSQKEKRHG